MRYLLVIQKKIKLKICEVLKFFIFLHISVEGAKAIWTTKCGPLILEKFLQKKENAKKNINENELKSE